MAYVEIPTQRSQCFTRMLGLCAAGGSKELFDDLVSRGPDREFCAAARHAGFAACSMWSHREIKSAKDLPDNYSSSYGSPEGAAVSIGGAAKSLQSAPVTPHAVQFLEEVVNHDPGARLLFDDHAYLRMQGLFMTGLVTGVAYHPSELYREKETAVLVSRMSAHHAHRSPEAHEAETRDLLRRLPKSVTHRRRIGLENALTNICEWSVPRKARNATMSVRRRETTETERFLVCQPDDYPEEESFADNRTTLLEGCGRMTIKESQELKKVQISQKCLCGCSPNGC